MPKFATITLEKVSAVSYATLKIELPLGFEHEEDLEDWIYQHKYLFAEQVTKWDTQPCSREVEVDEIYFDDCD